MKKGKIILLNGVSSSGKSSLAKELVEHLPDYFHISIDDFDYVIEKMENRNKNRLIPVPTEYFFHRTVKMFSDKGINLIVDQILHDTETLTDYIETFKDYSLVFVGVHCSVEELNRREQARGDRQIGLAIAQLSFVHQQQENYDVEVDTSKNKLETCVEQIKVALRSK